MDATDVTAKGYVNDEGFLLLKGASVRLQHADSIPKNVLSIREAAKEDGRLVNRGAHFELIEDIQFSSSSAAACFVAGHSRSGPNTWHDNSGKTLKQYEGDVMVVAENEFNMQSDDAGDQQGGDL